MTGTDKLIKLYETAMKELYREIAYREYRGNATGYQRLLLERVQTILKRLKRQTPGAVMEALKPAYLSGIRSFVKDIETTVGITLDPQIPWRQLNILIQNTTDQLTLATNRVGRIWQDAIRRAGIEATKHKLATGQTVDQMRRQLLTELMNINPRGRDGQTGIITKRGTMRLDSYAALVARSTTAEAQNASKIEMAREHGYDLAHFTKHSPTCGVCAQHEDRMYALTKEAANGKYKGPNGEPLHFPYLYDTAFVSGYDNIHPNCIHRLVIAVPEFMKPDELAVWSRKSMRPFEDTRSERDRKAYARIQADNRSRWQDRRQWERYRAVLPDQTPANFGEFRVMKRSKSDRWKDLQTDYKYVAKAIRSDTIKAVTIDNMRDAASGGTIVNEVIERIFAMLDKHGSTNLYNDVRLIKDDPAIVMQTDAVQAGTFFDTILNLNEASLGGKSVEEINTMFSNTRYTVANSLEEAILHEEYHAKLIKGLNYAQVESLYDQMSDIHIDGISPTAYKDGAECIAEVGVLIERGQTDAIPPEAIDLYKQYMEE